MKMTEWKPDTEFLDFIIKKFEKEGGDRNKVLIGAGQKGYNMNELVEEMKQGTKLGRRMYETFYTTDFEAYKTNKQK